METYTDNDGSISVIKSSSQTNIITVIKTYIKSFFQTYIERYIESYIERYIESYIERYIESYIERYIKTYIKIYMRTYIKRYILSSTSYICAHITMYCSTPLSSVRIWTAIHVICAHMYALLL